jgi:hypothetical protein
MKQEFTLDSGAKVFTEISECKKGGITTVTKVTTVKGKTGRATCTCTSPTGSSTTADCANGVVDLCDTTVTPPLLNCS